MHGYQNTILIRLQTSYVSVSRLLTVAGGILTSVLQLIIVHASMNPLKLNGNYMYSYFNNQQVCILTTGCVYGLRIILRISSDYFPKQH
jgi:hypothetical protein